ncbi:hypothetical protein PGT21_005631 [Puccinia graminis f. sp. tritici]|uniref:Uncharacterized protein n=1 Tax=Puccinia graminis f. sp. tritici TaxID=56615 RepID=A0A5B0MB84_PUCGR|nr:hypothetical protein PGT21_005631 [Puccinia graminis f. sp. tritici]
MDSTSLYLLTLYFNFLISLLFAHLLSTLVNTNTASTLDPVNTAFLKKSKLLASAN